MEKKNPITDAVGTPFEIWDQIAQLRNDLHISKVSIFINNLNNSLQQLKNDELFPILEFKPYYHGEDEGITNVDFFIYFRGPNKELPPHSFTVKNNPSTSFIMKMYNSLELSSGLIEFLETDKLHSTTLLKLDYDEKANREKLMEYFLDPNQLLKSRAILLDSDLKTTEVGNTKVKNKI